MSADYNVDESYAMVRRGSAHAGQEFLLFLSAAVPPQREAMCAIYAFMRYCDDLSDDEGIADRAAAIARWRDDLESALNGQCVRSSALARVRRRRRTLQNSAPVFLRHDRRRQSSDLEPRCIQTFEELYDYCYHVASVVGLTIIHIFGFDDPRALELAEKCGIAFQLTNILRDVREDYEKDRVYIPAEDFSRFGVSPATLVSTRGIFSNDGV